MGRGLSFEGIDISFGLSLPGEGANWGAAAAPLDLSAEAEPLNWGARAAALDRDATARLDRDAAEPFRRVLGDFLPDEGFSFAELPIEALSGAAGGGGSRLRGGMKVAWAAFRDGAGVKDFCLRLGRPFIDLDCLVGSYRAAVAECRALYDQCASATKGPAAVATQEASAAVGLPPAGPCASAFLLEFPLAFAYGTKERRHLDRLVRDLEGLPLTIAFFNPGWYSLRVIEALREKNIGLCLMDFPLTRHAVGVLDSFQGGLQAHGAAGDVAGSAPPRFDMATSSLVYLKFHGFSPARAAAGELKARFGSWIPRLEALALQAQTLRIIFQSEGG